MNGTGDEGSTPQSLLQFGLSWAEVEQLVAVMVAFIGAMRSEFAAYRAAPLDKHADNPAATAELDAVMKQIGAVCAFVKQLDLLLGDKIDSAARLDLAAIERPLLELGEQLFMLKLGRVDRLLQRVPRTEEGPGGPTLMPPDRELRATVTAMVEALRLSGSTATVAAEKVACILDHRARKLPGRNEQWEIVRELHRRRAKEYPADTPDAASARYHELVARAQSVRALAIKHALDPQAAIQDFVRTVLERHT